MGDLKLFRLTSLDVVELEGAKPAIERSLQRLFEKNMDRLLGTRFLASEYRIANGRIDTLGIDENFCPVIVEYKRATNENVISQGLFYLDWLMDHRRDFEWQVMERFGKEDAKKVEWAAPRLICIAADFTRYDTHAVKQISRNIELIRYRRFGEDLLLLDLVTATSAKEIVLLTPPAINDESRPSEDAGTAPNRYKSVTEYLADADRSLVDTFEALRAFLRALGDDVQERTLKNYFAFTRLRNFACVEIKPTARKLLVYLKVDPSTITLQKGFTRDVRMIGHFGTGELEITLMSVEDIERAKDFLEKSYLLS